MTIPHLCLKRDVDYSWCVLAGRLWLVESRTRSSAGFKNRRMCKVQPSDILFILLGRCCWEQEASCSDLMFSFKHGEDGALLSPREEPVFALIPLKVAACLMCSRGWSAARVPVRSSSHLYLHFQVELHLRLCTLVFLICSSAAEEQVRLVWNELAAGTFLLSSTVRASLFWFGVMKP